jgi:hypothetical protein
MPAYRADKRILLMPAMNAMDRLAPKFAIGWRLTSVDGPRSIAAAP